MSCANPDCECQESRTTRNGGSYCGDDCAHRAEVSARGHSQPAQGNERAQKEGCGCGHDGCH